MKDTTKIFYDKNLWQEIVTHPSYDLGERELDALIRFLPEVAKHGHDIANILHLGVGNGREIAHFISSFPQVRSYIINDICKYTLRQVKIQAKKQFPLMNFLEICADVESGGAVRYLRNSVKGQTLIVLIANAVIFSNRLIDKNIFQAMRRDDLFLITLETPHKNIYRSYAINPVYKLLSRSGLNVNADNTRIFYDNTDQCMKMECNKEILLASYKPTIQQLRRRMNLFGFSEIALREYGNIHMIGALLKKD